MDKEETNSYARVVADLDAKIEKLTKERNEHRDTWIKVAGEARKIEALLAQKDSIIKSLEGAVIAVHRVGKCSDGCPICLALEEVRKLREGR